MTICIITPDGISGFVELLLVATVIVTAHLSVMSIASYVKASRAK